MKIMGELMIEKLELPEDPLGKIFEAQRNFGGRFIPFDLFQKNDPCSVKPQRIEWRDLLLECIQNEMEEVRSWLDWKHWKEYEDFNYEVIEIRFELIDILHFLVNLCMVYDRQPKDIFNYIIDIEKSNKKNLQSMLLFLKGKMLISKRVDPTSPEIKANLTRQYLKEMTIDIGKAYNDDDIFPILRLVDHLFTLFTIWDMTPEDIFNYYMGKNKENFRRQEEGY